MNPFFLFKKSPIICFALLLGYSQLNAQTNFRSHSDTVYSALEDDHYYLSSDFTYLESAYSELRNHTLKTNFSKLKLLHYKTVVKANPSDSLALVTLYDSTGGDSWISKDNWLNGPMSTWYGVSVDDSGRVDSLVLSANNLVGEIPGEIGVLNALEYLWLDYNSLTGPIPAEIGDLKKLSFLNLTRNLHTGSIPIELTLLDSLRTLALGGNTLSNINFAELTNLEQLEALYLWWYRVNGPIPNEIESFGNLKILDFAKMSLTGGIPFWIGNMNNLEFLSLAGNNSFFNGSIPSELGNLSNLKHLSLENNGLNSSIPSEIGNLINIEVIDLQNNFLTGEIPPELGNLIKLKHLYLNRNYLTGEIPPELGSLIELENLYLNRFSNDSDALTGKIPIQFGNLSKLRNLSLENNNLTGSIPSELKGLINLEDLNLANNKLTGNFPPELGMLTKLKYLSLNGNELTGAIPVQLGNLLGLEHLYLYSNQFSGSIPPEIGNLLNLEDLKIFLNNFSGSIPEELNKLSKLKELWLSGNFFSSLPNLTSLSSLTRLDITNLKLTFRDIVPNINVSNRVLYWDQKPFGDTTFVQASFGSSIIFSVEEFDFEGNVYSWKKDDELIEELSFELILSDFSPADTGEYVVYITNPTAPLLQVKSEPFLLKIKPDNIDSLSLVSLYNSTGGEQWLSKDNWLNGTIDTWYGVTVDESGKVIALDLSNNNLIGELPLQIGNLKNLESLSLNDNLLTGKVPSEFRKLNNLQSLKLSNNKISSLPDLTSLSSLRSLFIENLSLDFRDIVPNIWVASDTINYNPQARLGDSTFVNVYSDSSVLFGVEPFHFDGNEYQWEKDGEAIISEVSSNIFLEAITEQDSGEYIVYITNSAAPLLQIRSEPFHIKVDNSLGTYDEGLFDSNIPESFSLHQNYPNPFNPSTYISYDLPQATFVTVTVYDITGKLIDTIENSPKSAGTHTIRFDASRLSSGVYLYKIDTSSFFETRKMLLIK